MQRRDSLKALLLLPFAPKLAVDIFSKLEPYPKRFNYYLRIHEEHVERMIIYGINVKKLKTTKGIIHYIEQPMLEGKSSPRKERKTNKRRRQ